MARFSRDIKTSRAIYDNINPNNQNMYGNKISAGIDKETLSFISGTRGNQRMVSSNIGAKKFYQDINNSESDYH